MAMNKSERAEMDALRMARDLARALAWPNYPMPETMTEQEIEKAMTVEMPSRYGHGTEKVAVGWYFNEHTMLITKGWSTTISHDTSFARNSARQRAGAMYRTFDDAARALRIAVTERVAEKLARVDRMIALGEPAEDAA